MAESKDLWILYNLERNVLYNRSRKKGTASGIKFLDDVLNRPLSSQLADL